jgi:hypothetical protein
MENRLWASEPSAVLIGTFWTPLAVAEPLPLNNCNVLSEYLCAVLQANFKIEYLCPDIDLKEITASVRGPNGDVECKLNLTPTGGSGVFIPTEVGMHEVR